MTSDHLGCYWRGNTGKVLCKQMNVWDTHTAFQVDVCSLVGTSTQLQVKLLSHITVFVFIHRCCPTWCLVISKKERQGELGDFTALQGTTWQSAGCRTKLPILYPSVPVMAQSPAWECGSRVAITTSCRWGRNRLSPSCTVTARAGGCYTALILYYGFSIFHHFYLLYLKSISTVMRKKKKKSEPQVGL